MSPRKLAESGPRTAASSVRAFFALLGVRLNETRVARRWSAQRLADEAGVSRGLVYLALRGESVSLEAALRMSAALGLKLEWQLVDAHRRLQREPGGQDVVHSALGEYEAAHFRQLRLPVSLDEPYQHYQFAGRADFVAWQIEASALLHIENRTRFPDFQESAGAFNAKRAYLGAALAQRLGVRSWRSETHVMVGLWSAEVMHAVRLRTESFRALCPDDASAFEAWWSGRPPRDGKVSTFVLLDPLAASRQRAFISLDEALRARPRYRGYADIASLLAESAA
jgi:transcriptional regulator with XRE-family HTH domain